MMRSASGPFDVKTLPQPPEANAEFAAVSRLLLDKQFHGDLQAVSRGQMLAMGGENGWGVYVAIEKVTGTLHARSGSFVLYHHGTMSPRGQQLNVTVAPESGSGDLVGLSGTMTINNVDGVHSYIFEYALPALD